MTSSHHLASEEGESSEKKGKKEGGTILKSAEKHRRGIDSTKQRDFLPAIS